jgi:hypothetical protein
LAEGSVRRLYVADDPIQILRFFCLAPDRDFVERAALVSNSELAPGRALDAGAGEREGSAAAGAPE